MKGDTLEDESFERDTLESESETMKGDTLVITLHTADSLMYQMRQRP